LTENDPDGGAALRMARCGVGALGVATEITLRVTAAHKLLEKTWCATRAEVRANHENWLRSHQHIRYMWIPFTDVVVVVGSNPLPEGVNFVARKSDAKQEAKKTEPMRRLLKQVSPMATIDETLGFGELRDALLAVDPLNVAHVQLVNAAEGEFWRRNCGTRCDWSDQILGAYFPITTFCLPDCPYETYTFVFIVSGFDCGGQQHVFEVAFKTGDSLGSNTGADLQYMTELLQIIEQEGIPAPAPIEQRWSAGSRSPMSPATNWSIADANSADVTGRSGNLGLHSWIGIIMYLPSEDETQRNAITNAFKKYAARETEALGDRYGIKTHWAKIELPDDTEDREKARKTMDSRYDTESFRKLRNEYDPKGVLGNDMIEGLLGDPARVQKRDSLSSAFWGPLERYAETQWVLEELRKQKEEGANGDDNALHDNALDTSRDTSPSSPSTSSASNQVPRKSFHRHLERKFNAAVENGSLVNVSIQIAMAVALHFNIGYQNLMRAIKEEDTKRAAAKREATIEADRIKLETATPKAT